MKAKDIREMTEDELLVKEKDLRQAVLNLRTQAQLGKMEKPHQIRLMRKDIARIQSVLSERKQ